MLATSEVDDSAGWSNYVYCIFRNEARVYTQYDFRVKLEGPPSAIAMWTSHEFSQEPLILASAPNSVLSEHLELFLVNPDAPFMFEVPKIKFLRFEVAKVKFEVYHKMRILDFEGEPNYGIVLNQRLVAYSKSSTVIYYRLAGTADEPRGELVNT